MRCPYFIVYFYTTQYHCNNKSEQVNHLFWHTRPFMRLRVLLLLQQSADSPMVVGFYCHVNTDFEILLEADLNVSIAEI